MTENACPLTEGQQDQGRSPAESGAGAFEGVNAMRIEVTADDVRKGKRMDSARCPVAIAINRARGFFHRMRVGRTAVASRITWIGCTPILNSINVSRFIAEFDAGHEVAPFTFDLPGLTPTA